MVSIYYLALISMSFFFAECDIPSDGQLETVLYNVMQGDHPVDKMDEDANTSTDALELLQTVKIDIHPVETDTTDPIGLAADTDMDQAGPEALEEEKEPGDNSPLYSFVKAKTQKRKPTDGKPLPPVVVDACESFATASRDISDPASAVPVVTRSRACKKIFMGVAHDE